MLRFSNLLLSEKLRMLILELEYLSKKLNISHIPEITGEILETLAFTYSMGKSNISVLEIGTGVGYSTSWILKGIIESGAVPSIKTIEWDPQKVEISKKIFEKYGFASFISFEIGDARKIITKISFPLDIIFMDASISDYYYFVSRLKPLLKIRGILIAHNVLAFRKHLNNFLTEIYGDDWRTLILECDPEGISISIKIK